MAVAVFLGEIVVWIPRGRRIGGSWSVRVVASRMILMIFLGVEGGGLGTWGGGYSFRMMGWGLGSGSGLGWLRQILQRRLELKGTLKTGWGTSVMRWEKRSSRAWFWVFWSIMRGVRRRRGRVLKCWSRRWSGMGGSPRRSWVRSEGRGGKY